MREKRPDDSDGKTIPVMSEEAVVGKQAVETGRVRVEKSVQYEDFVASDLLRREETVIDRIVHGIEVDPNDIPQVRQEEGVTIIPVLEEILVVEKRLVLKEELHIQRVVREETAEVPVTLKQERVTVTRDPSESQGADRGG
ncbi:YsnF/AvaK domain-containing protein [Stutzerimonas tarimensis]|uniref:YsnF/AvaK domain-containing protein n=1 Tax=Stutzerimonas tarimensis TaxID=1507735 RepID=A0ABV7T5U4_9GAMM